MTMTLADVRWIDIDHRDDDRGTLTVLEGSRLPFAIKRIFYMHHVPADHERGGHAHRDTEQFAIAVAGRFAFDASDGERTETFLLDDPNRGLYLPAMTWTRGHAIQPDTVALVVCNTAYDPQQVVRDWDEYRRLRREPSLTR